MLIPAYNKSGRTLENVLDANVDLAKIFAKYNRILRSITAILCRGGGTGRRTGLKILR